MSIPKNKNKEIKNKGIKMKNKPHHLTGKPSNNRKGETPRNRTLNLRLTESERDEIKALSKEKGLSVSDLVLKLARE